METGSEKPDVWDRMFSYSVAFFSLSLLIGLLLSGGIYYPLVFWEAWRYTDYSDGFTQDSFDQIKVGDTLESVQAKVGEPVDVMDYETDRWERYSESSVHGLY